MAPPVFDWLQTHGNVADEEMYRTFNCGIGMAVCVAPADAQAALECLTQHGEQAWAIGTIEQCEATGKRVIIQGVA